MYGHSNSSQVTPNSQPQQIKHEQVSYLASCAEKERKKKKRKPTHHAIHIHIQNTKKRKRKKKEKTENIEEEKNLRASSVVLRTLCRYLYMYLYGHDRLVLTSWYKRDIHSSQ